MIAFLLKVGRSIVIDSSEIVKLGDEVLLQCEFRSDSGYLLKLRICMDRHVKHV